MRNKRSGNSSKQVESSDDSPLEPNTSGSQSSSSSGKRAADMLANYKSNLDPSSGANSSSSKSNNSSGSVSLSEVRDGAHRLATELDEFLAKAAKNNRSFVELYDRFVKLKHDLKAWKAESILADVTHVKNVV